MAIENKDLTPRGLIEAVEGRAQDRQAYLDYTAQLQKDISATEASDIAMASRLLEVAARHGNEEAVGFARALITHLNGQLDMGSFFEDHPELEDTDLTGLIEKSPELQSFMERPSLDLAIDTTPLKGLLGDGGLQGKVVDMEPVEEEVSTAEGQGPSNKGGNAQEENGSSPNNAIDLDNLADQSVAVAELLTNDKYWTEHDGQDFTTKENITRLLVSSRNGKALTNTATLFGALIKELEKRDNIYPTKGIPGFDGRTRFYSRSQTEAILMFIETYDYEDPEKAHLVITKAESGVDLQPLGVLKKK